MLIIVKWIIGCICGVFILSLIGSPLYFNKGWFVWLYHNILGWCTPDDGPQMYDGVSMHARCRHCKREIMQDSQGNWF